MDFINKAKRVEMLSLRGKLLMLNFVVGAALVWLSVQAWHALNAQDQAQGKLVVLSEAFHPKNGSHVFKVEAVER